MTNTIEDINTKLKNHEYEALNYIDFSKMDDMDLCALFETFSNYPNELMEYVIDDLVDEIVRRARGIALWKNINLVDIWKFADGYKYVNQLWNDLYLFGYNEFNFIQNCIQLIKDIYM